MAGESVSATSGTQAPGNSYNPSTDRSSDYSKAPNSLFGDIPKFARWANTMGSIFNNGINIGNGPANASSIF